MILRVCVFVLALLAALNSAMRIPSASVSFNAELEADSEVDLDVEILHRNLNPSYAGSMIDSDRVVSCYNTDCIKLYIARHSGLDPTRRLFIIPVTLSIYDDATNEVEKYRKRADLILSSVSWLEHVTYHARLGPLMVLAMCPLTGLDPIYLPHTTVLVDLGISRLTDAEPAWANLPYPRIVLGDHYQNKDIILEHFDSSGGAKGLRLPPVVPFFHVIQRVKLQAGSIRTSARKNTCFFSGRFFDIPVQPTIDPALWGNKDKIVYFYHISRSVFSLCPDPIRSQRFFETLELGGIPVVHRESLRASVNVYFSANGSFARTFDRYPGPALHDWLDLQELMSSLDSARAAIVVSQAGFCTCVMTANPSGPCDLALPLLALSRFNINITNTELCKAFHSYPAYSINGSLYNVLVDIIQQKVVNWYKYLKKDLTKFMLETLDSIL